MNSAPQSALAEADRRPNPGRTTKPGPEPPHAISRDQIRELFLRELSHEERLLAVLWYVERMTPDEIALVLETSASRVTLDHARIIQKLG